MADWAPLEALAEPDPGEEWGALADGDRGSGEGCQGEDLVGVVERVSSSGRRAAAGGPPRLAGREQVGQPPVDLSGLQPGDEVTLEVQTSPTTGKRYIRALEGTGGAVRGWESAGR